jgi:hypothetical protein
VASDAVLKIDTLIG